MLELFSYLCSPTETVRLVQLVEHQIVVLGVVGSSPTSHPKRSALVGRTFRLRCGAPGAGAPGRAPGSAIHSKRPRPLSPCTPRGRGKGFPRTAAPSPFRRRYRASSVPESNDFPDFRTLQRQWRPRSVRFPGFPYASKTIRETGGENLAVRGSCTA